MREVTGMTWIVGAYMLSQPAAMAATGWTVQAVARAKAGAP